MPDAHTIRPAAVAGLFYPAEPEVLEDMAKRYLQQDHPVHPEGAHPKAIIAPHAGYVYSGALAGKSYAWVQPDLKTFETVVIFGPAHRVAFRGMAVPAAEGFATPLGVLPIDAKAKAIALSSPMVIEHDQPHAQEHSLEVQLPFLQLMKPAIRILPIVIGDCDPAHVADLIEQLDNGKTLFIISSDLTHFLDYETARQIDHQTADAIEHLDGRPITHHHACGATGIRGLLAWAKSHHLKCQPLGLCNSGDTAGDKSRVVGYGSWGFYA